MLFPFRSLLLTAALSLGSFGVFAADTNGNRLVYLDGTDPFYVDHDFPKLTTPQWVGEPDVEAVVILAIDDMRETKKYETFLRPILDRLKKIDGRAPVSIMTVAIPNDDPQAQAWLKEGLSLDIHTLTHPCPLLAKGNFEAAANTYHGCVDLLNTVPGNHPVAFRMPCCDSMNSPSPRFYAELFNRTSPGGKFLTIDSSVMNITTPKDTTLPRNLVTDADGSEKFRKYLPTETNATRKVSMKSFVTTIEDYPYPYVIGKLCWEFPAALPSDWEAFNLHGGTNPVTVADWKAGLDTAVLKQGTFTMIFHPHGWIRSDQIVELIDYAVSKHGKKVKFLTFPEAQARLDKHLLKGQPLRAANGQDNGVRLLDVNNDGYMDVVIGNDALKQTRIWNPKSRQWNETAFPTTLVAANHTDAGVKFGVTQTDGSATALLRSEKTQGAWHFTGGQWTEDKQFWRGLEVDGQPVRTLADGHDTGVRFRDTDKDGRDELLLSNPKQSAVFTWSTADSQWKKMTYALPRGTSIVNERGEDNGLRFVDLNGDGFEDVIFSNEDAYSVHTFIPVAKPNVDWRLGWSLEMKSGKHGTPVEVPMIVRGGTNRNNGVWFHSRHLWVQNEDVAHLPDKVDRHTFDELLTDSGPPPRSPQESLACIKVRPGFKVELVAQEPLVMDPIAFEWGADGKLWVVEMGDYPLGIDNQGKHGGIVRFLEDTNGDGIYDKSTVFLDGIGFPTGVMPWGKGVLVSTAPDIFYAEDTDGDGKADVRKVLFSGFREGNQQHRVNGFEYGLDNWVYVANGDSGGTVKSEASGKVVDLRGHDLRFRPDTGELQTQAGQTQYGRHRDDWGNWFGNNNPNWIWHYHLPEQYLVRNPYLAVKTTRQMLPNYPQSNRIFTISPTMRRHNWPDALNVTTSANSATPYRDDLFGPEFATSAFASEPVNNVVHREVLERDGVTFTSHRPADEQDREFLASTDNWFRPVMTKTGPDGALYIADMYRIVIEHPEWIPAETQKRVDLRAGHDKGHLYRVYPEGKTLRKIPRLDRLDAAGLVAALDSPNGWQRDTAQRLLVQRADKSVAAQLAALAAKSANPKARLQALCTADGLGLATPALLLAAFRDSHPAVREHAVRISESMLASPPNELADALPGLADDPDIRVRYQLAFTLGEWRDRRAATALAKIALRDQSDPKMMVAVMSSATPHVGEMLAVLFSHATQTPPASLVEQLISLATSLGDNQALAKALAQLGQSSDGRFAPWQFASLGGFLDALDRRNSSLKKFRTDAKPELQPAVQALDGLFTQARKLADSPAGTSSEETQSALRLLGRGADGQKEDIKRLGAWLHPQIASDIQKVAVQSLARLPGADVELLAAWKAASPGLRAEILNVLFTRQDWIQSLLTAVEGGRIGSPQIDTVYQQKLLGHSQNAIRERAAKVFAARNADRLKVVKEYSVVMEMTGDTVKGAALFRANCMICHKLKGEGVEIGPDLTTVADKPVDVFLNAILDPNQAVEARYLSYTAVTKSGRELTGILMTETPNSITLKNASGNEEVVLRADLKELIGSGLSLMPEGFENAMKPQDLANLISFIKSAR